MKQLSTTGIGWAQRYLRPGPGRSRLRGRRIAAASAAAVLLAAGAGIAAQSAAQAGSAPQEGIDCDTAANGTFTLGTKTGQVLTPDGNSIYSWGFTNEGDGRGFQLPGPTLCVNSGQAVTVILHNTLSEPVSIVFHGQSGVKAGGNPAQPQFDSGNTLTSLVQPAPASNGSMTYTFKAGAPGTYLYSSGTDVNKQTQMGLFGALVVRPSGHADQATDAGSTFNSEHEYLFVLSEIDPDIHLAVERGETPNWAAYKPRYFMMNGRSMPDTMAPNNASWLPSQPYGAMVHIQPYDEALNPKPALIRYLNAGTENYPFHPHGSDERVVSIDGHPRIGPGGEDLSYNKFDLNVQPGQSLDATMVWTNVDQWDPNTNPIPTTLPAITDQLLVGTDTWFSESPYLGHKGNVPTYITDNNQCGEYYHIAHSHALQQATNYGATFGGMMTVYRIDPPGGCR